MFERLAQPPVPVGMNPWGYQPTPTSQAVILRSLRFGPGLN
ncbi:MAG TPA: hypothetical protein VGZ03_10850 [Acidimicrobiales bacterium]|nr:hypothetical protein [Acidimicrobiales bacterium]